MEIRAAKFRVGSQWRVGGLFSPSEPGRRGAVLLLHGFPGVQQNEDFAYELCRLGLSAFLPRYRGCWGSAGEFSVSGLLDDVKTAYRLLRRYPHVDPRRTAILGFSVGGWLALRLAAEVRPAAVAAVAPAVPWKGFSGDAAYLRRNAKVLKIEPVQAILREYLETARTAPPEGYVPRIAPSPILFVHGLKDRLVPPASTRALCALAGQPKSLLELEEEGHEFCSDRRNVVSRVCGWLAARLGCAEAAGHVAPGILGRIPA